MKILSGTPEAVKLGAMLRDIRVTHKLTQQDVADELGVTQRSVSRYELGSVVAPFDHLDMMFELSKPGYTTDLHMVDNKLYVVLGIGS
jgi:transcriptional regulator with XRE-family HTH domain